MNITFVLRKVAVLPDEPVWFDFSVTNGDFTSLSYGLLGAEITYADGRYFFIQPSLRDGVMGPGQVLSKSDRFTISTPGTFAAQLIICYNKLSVCNSSGDGWERISPEISFLVYAGDTLTPTP
jgi:hypothetical protein